MREEINREYRAHLETAKQFEAILEEVADAVQAVIDTFSNGGKVLLAGNGGSAADAQHWAAEWVIRLNHHLNRPAMPAIALTTDSSNLTAGANDLSFEEVFSRQVEALAQPGDLFIGISTSGNSANVLRAAKMAHEKGAKVLGILGGDGGKIIAECDHAVVVPSKDTQRIQEMHVFVGHQLCSLSERALWEKP
ncbi:D-sedoheptulose 7-phosphate isomerase [bacterium]|nr:D-sedoheptulose 7-phosphate isomerase [bacterium]